MTDNEEWMSEAKARLVIPKKNNGRAGSVAARVRALHPEMMAARAAGKTWEEIATDLSDNQPLNSDAVRIAFARCSKRANKASVSAQAIAAARPTAGNKATEIQSCNRKAESVETKSGVFDDMFAPLFDARDTKGRSAYSHPTKEERA